MGRAGSQARSDPNASAGFTRLAILENASKVPALSDCMWSPWANGMVSRGVAYSLRGSSGPERSAPQISGMAAGSVTRLPPQHSVMRPHPAMRRSRSISLPQSSSPGQGGARAFRGIEGAVIVALKPSRTLVEATDGERAFLAIEVTAVAGTIDAVLDPASTELSSRLDRGSSKIKAVPGGRHRNVTPKECWTLVPSILHQPCPMR